MSEAEIRLACADDAEAIAQVLLHAFVEYKSLYTEKGFIATTPGSSEILVRMKEGSMWVALLRGQVVGTASTVLKSDSVYVRGMAVLPSVRGEGIGDMLLHEIEVYAIKQGARRTFLSTTPFLDRAIRLYERFGFRRTNEGPHDLFGTPLFTMEKFLTRVSLS